MPAVRHPLARPPILPPPRRSPARAEALPPALHRLPLEDSERPSHPLARTRPVALVEAALILADEPLPPRKLAQVCGLPDAAAAREAVNALRALLEKDNSSFQVEE